MSEHVEDIKIEEKQKMDEAQADYTDETAVKPRNNNWIAGVVLIAVGIIFLFSNVTNFYIQNWWALFILIPAFINFGRAWQVYQAEGRFTKSARGSLTGGIILSLIAAAFLFTLDWGLVWPMFLIIGGIAALLGGWFD